MATSKTETKETQVLRGKEALKDLCLSLGVKLGKKKPQERNPRLDKHSPLYDKKLAKNRAKEKARRKANRITLKKSK